MTPDPVTVAWVHEHECAHSWASSMLSLQTRFFQSGRPGRYVAMRGGTGNLVEARNKAVMSFLEGDQPWLFWIDTDMGFEPSIVDDLLEHADPVERPVVGALAFAQKEQETDGRGGFSTFPVPTIYRWAQQPDGKTGFVSWHEYPRDQLVECQGTGSACILIHRTVFERIADDAGGAPVWYNRAPDPNDPRFQMSEDLSFCLRLAALDIPLHVHTGVKTTHLKFQWLSEVDHTVAMVAAAAAASRDENRT